MADHAAEEHMDNIFLAFGEILFDIFPDGERIGGAPLNVATHLARLGFDAGMISAVGRDSLGMDAIDVMEEEGVMLDYMTVLDGEETGRADIRLVDGNADYVFNEPAAWDQIPYHPGSYPRNISCLYCGTLAQRSKANRRVLRFIIHDTTPEMLFFDVNLRKDYYDGQSLRLPLETEGCIVKMNEEEVGIVASALGIEASPSAFLNAFPLTAVLVTEGKRGASIYLQGGKSYHQPVHPCKVVDTVGAGDAFSAGFIAGQMNYFDMVDSMELGSLLASYAVSHRGATPHYDEDLAKALHDFGFHQE